MSTVLRMGISNLNGVTFANLYQGAAQGPSQGPRGGQHPGRESLFWFTRRALWAGSNPGTRGSESTVYTSALAPYPSSSPSPSLLPPLLPLDLSPPISLPLALCVCPNSLRFPETVRGPSLMQDGGATFYTMASSTFLPFPPWWAEQTQDPSLELGRWSSMYPP